MITRACGSGLNVPLLLAAISLACSSIFAQTSSPSQSSPISTTTTCNPYAVTVVRKTGDDERSSGLIGVALITVTAIPLRDLVMLGYHIQQNQIVGGPAWANATTFAIEAKADEAINTDTNSMSEEQRKAYNAQSDQCFRTRVQNLLADRFKLKVHWEDKEVPVYALVLAKGGPKMKPSSDQSDFKKLGLASQANNNAAGIRGTSRGGEIAGIKSNMDQLTRFLATYAPSELGRPIVNKTGLTGEYDFKLKWTPDLGPGSPPLADNAPPPFFIALREQLGLALESQKGSTQILVIDSAVIPAEN